MIIRVEASLTISVPAKKNSNNYVKQSVTLELDHLDIVSLVTGKKQAQSTISLEGIEDAVVMAQGVASRSVWEAAMEDVEELLGE